VPTPKWYKGGAAAGNKPAEGLKLPTIAWGSLTLSLEKALPVTCENLTAGDIENPAGERAGVGETESFNPYDCVQQ
jgi:hypothetical protein